jgi:hypothetical protein
MTYIAALVCAGAHAYDRDSGICRHRKATNGNCGAEFSEVVDTMAAHQSLVSSRREGGALEGRMAARRERRLETRGQIPQHLCFGHGACRVARRRQVGPREPGSADHSQPSICAFATARQRREAASRAQTDGRRQCDQFDALRDFEDGLARLADEPALTRPRAALIHQGGTRHCCASRLVGRSDR